MNVAYAVLIEIGEGKGLQMIEAPLLQVTAYAHFHTLCRIERQNREKHLSAEGQTVKNGEQRNGVKHLRNYVVVDGVPLEKRNDNVDAARCKTE